VKYTDSMIIINDAKRSHVIETLECDYIQIADCAIEGMHPFPGVEESRGSH
jgi:hypothetical protein